MTLRIELMGTLNVWRNGQPIKLPPSKKTRALLAYLALTERPRRREHLCEMFWDIPDDPRGALRWSLSKLRRILNDDKNERLQADRDTVFLARDNLAIDYNDVSQIHISAINNVPDETLESAAAAFRGRLMEDLSLYSCPLFEAWRVALANEHELVHMAVLRELLDRNRGDPEHALGFALSLQKLDPEDAMLARVIAEFTEAIRDSVLQTPLSPLKIADGGGEKQIENAQSSVDRQPVEIDTAKAEPERRLVSVLHIELVSSLFDDNDLDAEIIAELIDPVMADLTATIEFLGGASVFRGQTDLTAIFGTDRGVEEHAFLACRAALEIRNGIAKKFKNNIELRAAIDTGEALMVHSIEAGQSVIKPTGNLIMVARQMARGLARNTIVLSQRSRTAAGGYVVVNEMAVGEITGAASNIKSYELQGETAALSRWHMRDRLGLSRFVGRSLEIQLLEHAWQNALNNQSRTVGIVADPGIGKSRLVHEFLSSDRLAEAARIECGALEVDSQVSLLLAKKLLLALCDFELDAEEDEITAALETMLAPEKGLSDLLSPLHFLFDLEVADPSWRALSSPEQLSRVATAIATLLDAEARISPVAVLIEDLHWIDEASETVLRRLVETLPVKGILLICTYRPSYNPPWAHPHSFDQIALTPLKHSETEMILRELLGNDSSLAPLISALSDRADGVPLFIEEMVRTLTREGRLDGVPGAYSLDGDVQSFQLPASVQSLIVANMQGLDEACKSILQLAAAIGRHVPFDLLRRASQLQSDILSETVARLCEIGLLVTTRLHPMREYKIKHALLEEAAYSTLTKKNRIALHIRIFNLIEKEVDGDPSDQSEMLARHAFLGEIWERAARYFLPSAQRAIERSAHGLALSHIRDGLTALEKLPETTAIKRLEINYRKVEGVAWMMAKGWSAKEVLATYDRAAELSAQLGDNAESFSIMRGKAQYFMISGRPREAQDIANRCSVIVEHSDNPDVGMQIETSHMYWTNGFFLGDYATVLDHADRAASIYEPDRHHDLTYQYSGHDPGVCCRIFKALAQELTSDPESAGRTFREALVLAERFGHPLTTALVCWGMSFRGMFHYDARVALEWSEKEIAICDEHMLPLLRAQGEFARGWAIFGLGDREAGLHQMEEGVRAIREIGAEMGLPYLLALFAETQSSGGGQEKAIQLIEEALAQVQRSGSRFQISEILRIKAGILERTQNDEDSIEQLYQEAIASARQQKARLVEARAVSALEAFHSRNGRLEKAVDLQQN